MWLSMCYHVVGNCGLKEAPWSKGFRDWLTDPKSPWVKMHLPSPEWELKSWGYYIRLLSLLFPHLQNHIKQCVNGPPSLSVPNP